MHAKAQGILIACGSLFIPFILLQILMLIFFTQHTNNFKQKDPLKRY